VDTPGARLSEWLVEGGFSVVWRMVSIRFGGSKARDSAYRRSGIQGTDSYSVSLRVSLEKYG